MAKHVKPTQEELQDQVEKVTKEAEELVVNTTEEEPEAEEVASEPEVTEEEPAEAEQPAEELVEKQAEPSKEIYKRKFSASSRENQKIAAKNRVINQAIIEAEDIPEPTDEEMQSIYKNDWDVMSDIDRDLAKETIVSKKWRAKIKEASDQATKIEKWAESVETFTDDPNTLTNNPQLEGKIEEFKTFATEETNNSVPFKVLISAFLHENSTQKKTNSGRMFERGSGGPNDKPEPKSDTITLEQARNLRETNYSKYKEYLISGKIKSDF
jgi:hypothetical protein